MKLEYKFGQVFRQVKQRSINYCDVVKNGKFVSTDPVMIYIYNSVKESLPPVAYTGCPVPKGLINLTDVSIPIQVLPFSHLVPYGTYRAFANISSKGRLIGHGHGQAEVTTPLKYWS